jgi:hypothetical protein
MFAVSCAWQRQAKLLVVPATSSQFPAQEVPPLQQNAPMVCSNKSQGGAPLARQLHIVRILQPSQDPAV